MLTLLLTLFLAAGTARTLPIPSSGGDTASPAPAVQTLTWEVPKSWKEETPASPMRRKQYRIAGPAGDAECVVFYFGPGQGGDASANAIRWANQFEQPDGRSPAEAMKLETLDGTGLPVQLVQVTGTYNGGMTMTDAPAPKQPGSMLLGGIVAGPDAPWFFKLTGPEATVRAQYQMFVGMLRSVRLGPA